MICVEVEAPRISYENVYLLNYNLVDQIIPSSFQDNTLVQIQIISPLPISQLFAVGNGKNLPSTSHKVILTGPFSHSIKLCCNPQTRQLEVIWIGLQRLNVFLEVADWPDYDRQRRRELNEQVNEVYKYIRQLTFNELNLNQLKYEKAKVEVARITIFTVASDILIGFKKTPFKQKEITKTSSSQAEMQAKLFTNSKNGLDARSNILNQNAISHGMFPTSYDLNPNHTYICIAFRSSGQHELN